MEKERERLREKNRAIDKWRDDEQEREGEF